MITYMPDKKAFRAHMRTVINTYSPMRGKEYRDRAFFDEWESKVKEIHQKTKYLNKLEVRQYVELELLQA
jgi:hypothetical protein